MGKLLTVFAQVDPYLTLTQETSELVVKAWHAAVGDLDFDDAFAAAAAYYGQPVTRRIMPGDVREGVKAIRRERARELPPAEDLMADVQLDPLGVEYGEILRARREALLTRPAGTPLREITRG
jgi:hypothetical protein